MTTLKELTTLGGVVADAPIQKEIQFEGNPVAIYVKQLGIGEYEAIYLADADGKSRTARLISKAITVGDGKEAIPYEVALRLHPALAGSMLEKFHEVNNPKKP